MGFQSVAGLVNCLQTENINEGGVNLYTHVVPTRKKAGPLVMKRGLLAPVQSGLTDYLIGCFQNETITPMPYFLIKLRNENHNPMLVGKAPKHWPRSWNWAS